MAVCEAIRAAVKGTSGRTVRDIATSVGLSEDVLSNVMRKKTKPDTDMVDRLRAELKLPRDWPHSRVHNPDGQRVSLAGTPMAPLQIVGAVHAGSGFANVDYDERTVYVPERLAQVADYGWITEGDSMMPFLEPGDAAAFRRLTTPRRGYIFLIQREGELRVKRIDWNDGRWIMTSLNSSFPPESLDGWQILGLMVGMYRYQGSRETIVIDVAGLRPE